jgi:glyoxylate/hydroxypyruvate reductase
MTSILVFSPDEPEALRYRQLLEAALPGAPIGSASTAKEARPFIADAEIIFGWKFPAGLLGQAASLRWIHKVSAGVEDVVSDPGRPASVRLSRSDGSVIAPRMSEYVLAAIYATNQKLMQAVHQQAGGLWRYYMVDRAAEKTVGIAGLGDIGSAIAAALHKNGMRVVGWRRSKAQPPNGVDRVYSGRAELRDFVSECDFVVSVLPSTEETKNVFDADVFAAMRPDAVFVNIGRGASVDEDALADAITNKRIGGAVLDVFKEEPLPASSLFWGLDRVIITPHVSGPIIPEDVVPFFIENFRRYRSGERLLKEVDLARGY